VKRVFFRALVWEHLKRERLRACATLLAIVLGVGLVLSIDLANATAVASFSSSVDVVTQHVNLQVVANGAGMPERAYPGFLAAAAVRDAQAVVEAQLTIGAKSGDPFAGDVLHIIGSDMLHSPRTASDVPTWRAANGPRADPDVLVNGHGAIVGEHIATRYGLRVGSILRGTAGDRIVQLRVAQILPSGLPGVDSSVVFVDVATAQELFDRLGRLDRIDLQVDPARREAIARELAPLVPPGARIITPQNRSGEIRRMLASFQLNLAALSYVALLVGLFLIYNTVAISVVQRRGDIGILRALGTSKNVILQCFLAEGALFGIVGSGLGLAIGAFLARYSVAAVTKTVDSMYVSTHTDGVAYAIEPFVKAFVIGLLASILAALFPAREAASTPPSMTMRGRASEVHRPGMSRRSALIGAACFVTAYGLTRLPALESVPVFGYGAGFLIICGGAAFVPLGIRIFALLLRRLTFLGNATSILAATNLAAAQRRNTVAIASLMTAVGMMVAIAILVGSFRTTVVAWANDTLKADLFIRPLGFSDASYSAHLDPALVQRFANAPGVDVVDTFRAMSFSFRGRLSTLAGVDFATVARRGQLRFLGNPPIEPLVAAVVSGGSAVVSEPFSVRFGVRPGDDLTIDTALGQRHVRVAAIYNDYSSDSGFLLFDRGTYVRYFDDKHVNSIAVYAKPGADLLGLRAQLERRAVPSRVDIVLTRELRGYVIKIFDRTFAITYALYVITIAIAVLGVVSTLFALVLERRTEIGILRYVGVPISGIYKLILLEAASIGLLGGLYGVGIGILLAFDLIYVINRQAFGWLIELRMPWEFLGEAIVLVTLAAVASGFFPARVAAQMSTATLSRDE
jgi:putative ABC transport system permease protein